MIWCIGILKKLGLIRVVSYGWVVVVLTTWWSSLQPALRRCFNRPVTSNSVPESFTTAYQITTLQVNCIQLFDEFNYNSSISDCQSDQCPYYTGCCSYRWMFVLCRMLGISGCPYQWNWDVLIIEASSLLCRLSDGRIVRIVQCAVLCSCDLVCPHCTG